ncbi:MAG: YbaK/EbsC family protein [Candidatus Moranbacteria bacterium]|nr:YbaK/EbsC family protein [Candidatus Moranbacteria bacterium]
MAISKKIIDHLKEKKYKFEIIEHKTTYTAFDTARTAQKQEKEVKSDEIAKALVVKADKDYAVVLVPASKRLDKKKLLKIINALKKKNKEKLYKSLDLAKEAWMKKNIPGKVGATPAFKELLGIDIYIDAVLAKQKNLYVGSGEYEYSIKLPAKQYLKNEMPVKGSFGVKR